MQSYRRMALWTTAATYFLIFVGGLVRVAGAGMGCPDWPKCFGRWIPPLSISQLPPEIDPSTFNITLAWIEYCNRLAGVTVGFLIVATAILAIRHFRHTPGVLYPSLAAGVLVAVQGWQGSQVVASDLQPFIVTIHMVLALLIVSLLLYATLRSYSPAGSDAASSDTAPPLILKLAGLLWIGTLMQIVLGSQVRQALETAAKQFPDLSGQQWFESVGAINDFHFIFGILVAVLTFYVGQAVMRTIDASSTALVTTVRALYVLVILQAGSGVVLQVSGLPALTDLFHLWMAAIFVGLIMVLHSLLKRAPRSEVEWSQSYPRLIWVSVVLIFLLGVGAYFVIDQADRSRQEAGNVTALILELRS